MRDKHTHTHTIHSWGFIDAGRHHIFSNVWFLETDTHTFSPSPNYGAPRDETLQQHFSVRRRKGLSHQVGGQTGRQTHGCEEREEKRSEYGQLISWWTVATWILFRRFSGCLCVRVRVSFAWLRKNSLSDFNRICWRCVERAEDMLVKVWGRSIEHSEKQHIFTLDLAEVLGLQVHF